MNFFKAVFGVFRRSGIRTEEVPSGSIEFAGEPTGDADVLKDILRRGLAHDRQLKRAYLVLIRHSAEAECRLALCIYTDSAPKKVIGLLSKHCPHFIENIDIMFFCDFSQSDIDRLKAVVSPFWGEAGCD